MTIELAQAPDKVVNIAQEFSRTPGGRYYTDGPASGQQFREEVLVPALNHNQRLLIQLDGARGYPSSFLEEAFGGLIRSKVLTKKEFFERLRFEASGAFSIYVDDIRDHVEGASVDRGG